MSKYQLKKSSIYIDGTDIPYNKLGIKERTSLSQIKDYGRGFLCHEYEIKGVMLSRTMQPLLT